MAVNLSKNGNALTAAYRAVLDAKSGTNWSLFTYEGDSNDVRVAGKGGGGLKEMVQQLNSSKVMYAFCRVIEPNSGVPKFVLINWTGEGVKAVRKGMCAGHVQSMASFLRGAHVTINARSADDVEPDAIMTKVAQAAGVNYNVHKESNHHNDAGLRENMKSAYKKISALEEVKGANSFWEQMEKEERERRRQERQKANERRLREEEERRKQDEKETEERERRQRERANQIKQQRAYENKQDSSSTESELKKQKEDEEETQTQRKGIRSSKSFQTASEAAAIISQRAVNPKDVFKQRERNSFTNGVLPSTQQQGRLKSPFLKQQTFSGASSFKHSSPASSAARTSSSPVRTQSTKASTVSSTPPASAYPLKSPGRLKSPFLSQQSSSSEKPPQTSFLHSSPASSVARPTSSPVRTPSTQTATVVSSTPAASAFPKQSPGRLKSPFLRQQSLSSEEPPLKPVQLTPPAFSPAQHTFPSVHTPSPQAATVSSTPAAPAFPQNTEHFADDPFVPELEDSEDEWQDSDEEESDEEQTMASPSEATSSGQAIYENIDQYQTPAASEQAPGQNIRARALYDYQAADDSEISFDPDDIITEIEMLDGGWWRGTGPDGHNGLLPGNYVELI